MGAAGAGAALLAAAVLGAALLAAAVLGAALLAAALLAGALRAAAVLAGALLAGALPAVAVPVFGVGGLSGVGGSVFAGVLTGAEVAALSTGVPVRSAAGGGGGTGGTGGTGGAEVHADCRHELSADAPGVEGRIPPGAEAPEGRVPPGAEAAGPAGVSPVRGDGGCSSASDPGWPVPR